MNVPGFGLDGMVVSVTGAGKGIGRASALDAARAGAKILGCSRTASDLDELRTERHGRDVADPEGARGVRVLGLPTS
jgi:NAD(P)-dependent dehydrogenase (short-subunit alcohol dehydrogenase family)